MATTLPHPPATAAHCSLHCNRMWAILNTFSTQLTKYFQFSNKCLKGIIRIVEDVDFCVKEGSKTRVAELVKKWGVDILFLPPLRFFGGGGGGSRWDRINPDSSVSEETASRAPVGAKIVAFSWVWLPRRWTAASDGRLLGVTFVAPLLPKSIHTPCLSKLTSAALTQASLVSWAPKQRMR